MSEVRAGAPKSREHPASAGLTPWEAARLETAATELASRSRFFEAALSSIPDFVYAFDPHHRFAYANPAMLALFGLTADELLGKTFADLRYPVELADLLNNYIDDVLRDGVTVRDEVFFRSPTGYTAYFNFLWGPVRGDDGSVDMVVGVSRDMSERRAFEEAMRSSEERLRAATSLARIGIYTWDPVNVTLEWDERLRAMWGLSADCPVNMEVFEKGVHPEDLPRVRQAIADCVNPAGNGRYDVEYRVIRRNDGAIRHVAASGQTTFSDGRAVHMIGAARDVTEARMAEAAIRASEAQFRAFADHSSNLMWIADPGEGKIIYRSAAYESIWGVEAAKTPTTIADWIEDVHPEDRQQVEHGLATVMTGEVAQFECRIVRPVDGTIRALRGTTFPILDESGAVVRIGGITEDLTSEDVRQVYIVCTSAAEARQLAAIVRAMGYRARTFSSASAFLELASVLAPGCLLVDLRHGRGEALSIPRELKARSIFLPAVAFDADGADVGAAVAAMKSGAVDYVIRSDEQALRTSLAEAMALCRSTVGPNIRKDTASARISRLTARERDVLTGLIDGGTNKSIGKKLGISPRTVEMHRAQVMNRLNARSLPDLIQIALGAGLGTS